MSGRKQEYSWDTIRRAYVAGDMSLHDLSREKTGRDRNPPYQSIRRAAASNAQGTWEDQRKAFRQQLVQVTALTPTAQQIVRR